MTDTSPAFLPVILCGGMPASASSALQGALPSGRAVRAYRVSLCAVNRRRASAASSAVKEAKRALACAIQEDKTKAG